MINKISSLHITILATRSDGSPSPVVRTYPARKHSIPYFKQPYIKKTDNLTHTLVGVIDKKTN